MCGIVALCYAADNPALGWEAGELLKRLEYRGYDSTGGAFVGDDHSITLLKAVGAPSRVVPALGIDAQAGQRFVGQVRWATYGAVTQENCQPHEMSCTRPFVGAHNGNISNTDTLKTYLGERGHRVVSDNDGEMIAHLTEGFSADPALPLPDAELPAGVPELPAGALRLIEGARRADALADGSYAAAFCDPAIPGIVAVKSGSSLYAGLGSDAAGPFVVVSSDLTSVLSKTPRLIPLAEGQGLWFTHDRYVVFDLAGALNAAVPEPRRSRLNVRDTGLRPGFEFFMDQEIASTPENLDEVARYYLADPAAEGLEDALAAHPDAVALALAGVRDLYEAPGEPELATASGALLGSAALAELRAAAPAPAASEPVSADAVLLRDVARLHPDAAADVALLDAALVWQRRAAVRRDRARLAADLREAVDAGGRVFLVASGTSSHAALTGARFFTALAGLAVFPCNPGTFRSLYLDALGPRDVVLAITQSGETKDLVDILVDVAAARPSVRRVCLVNNENSRIPQELVDYYLPLLCGPEIAVAATKSFVSQLAILYLLAGSFTRPDAVLAADLTEARRLVEATLRDCGPALDEVAERLALEPSLHILGSSLIGVAKEGALKVREVVLNHTEGYDAAEFKHGPNTILGKNTLFSIADLEALAAAYAHGEPAGGFAAAVEQLFGNYPLVFVCPPNARDARITISQIHTHKIRGADIVLLAEPDAALRLAVEGVPTGFDDYWARCVDLPAGGDEHLFVFSASVALQRLALRMCEIKMRHLDALGIADHGVHPDAPKNVSKSITVD